MKLFTAIILFILMLGMYLSLLFILNYALLQSDNQLMDYLPASFTPVYQLFNMLWTSLFLIGGIYVLIRNVDLEGLSR